ncbi:hypothetical protein PMIN06_000210 [Paraphaeosphaeria minitans]
MSARQGLSNLASLSVSRVALNPVVAGALLWALIRGPASVRGRLINSVSALRNPQTRARVTKLLGWLLALGVVRTVNKKLNHLALNAYRTNDEQKRWQWNEEVAVVTGGCSGIGMLTAKRLLLRGVKVAILDIQQLPPALRDCAGVGFFACDVSDPAAVASTADEVRATLGPPSILVNNAGITHPHTILQTSPEYLRRIFDINLLSNWYTIQAFLPHMIEENKGHVVTVASMASYWSVGGMVDYCATKAAVLCLHEGLVQEVRQKHEAPNLLFTSVHPHFVQTPLAVPYAAKLTGVELLEPAEVADAIAGQVLACAGGQIYLPENACRATLVRGWPNWVQELLRGRVARTMLSGTE